MTGIMKKVTEFYKKDECSKYYKLGKTLGTGSFATVKSAISKADNSRWAEMKRYNARRRFRYGIMAAKTISALNSAQKRVSASDFDPPVAAIAAVGLEAVKTAAPTTTEGGTPAAPAPAPAGTQ
ncbi:hypothetical protein PC118_g9592 [Phytophthora cactorum]|uniref:Protein kinase domain-containing protein n=1 Tax=Phytophthora cactorum TaxID=29920 RepID=A0A8T1G2J3_9STRA|nr:hypothetical protein PC118_g9592 [Phytophthora cactorum]